jgi:hypothetical protein
LRNGCRAVAGFLGILSVSGLAVAHQEEDGMGGNGGALADGVASFIGSDL